MTETEIKGKWVVEAMQGYDTGKFRVVRWMDDDTYPIASRLTEAEAHAIAQSRENAKRVEELEIEVEELESEAETVSTEFEGECWKAMRSLLDECGFNWGYVDEDGVTAEMAREHTSMEIAKFVDHAKRQAARIEALECAVESQTRLKEMHARYQADAEADRDRAIAIADNKTDRATDLLERIEALKAALREIATNEMETRDTSLSVYDTHWTTVVVERPSSDLADIAAAALSKENGDV